LADFYKLRSKFACVFFEVGASFIANGRLLYFFVAVYLRNGFIAKLFFLLECSVAYYLWYVSVCLFLFMGLDFSVA
jgi:hypothetical protein